MNSVTGLHYHNTLTKEISPKNNAFSSILKFSMKNERKVLKVVLLWHLHQLFFELFHSKIQCNQNNSSMECYTMDSKIIQLLIHGIIETGEYTLEGIAYYTRIPFDVIYEAACGINKQFSITTWIRVVDLYIQVKPDVVQVIIDKLLEIKNKNHAALLSLLNES